MKKGLGSIMSWTAPHDVRSSWVGPNPPTDDELIRVWIDKAEREILFRVPDIQARLDAEAARGETLLLDTVRDVVVAMVTRVFKNPEGIRTTNYSSGTGPFSESRSQTYGGDHPGGLYISDDELAKLSPSLRGGAFEIDLLGPRAGYGHASHGWMDWHPAHPGLHDPRWQRVEHLP